jgi:hypothetical protein
MIDREPCGCKHDGTKWLELCPTHRAEHDTRHVQAQADYREQENRREGAAAFKRLF